MNKIMTFIVLAVFLSGGTVASSVNLRFQRSYFPLPESYQLLIISPAEFSKQLSPLVEHKNNMEMETLLVTLETIQSAPEVAQGQDDAEKMKYYIKYAMETYGVSYVLLVGGRKGQSNNWYLPVRYVNMDNGWEPHFTTDLYFADIYDANGDFSSWNEDNDNYYGEWIYGENPIDGNLDLYPDVSVGRLPCRYPSQVNDVVNKIITYETNGFQQSWFEKILAIAGDTYLEIDNPDWAGIEGEQYADLALSYMSGFSPTRLFLSDGSFTGSTDVIDAINQGFGFVYFVGHGNPNTWGNHPPNNHTFVTGLQNHEMPQLVNEPMYPVCVVSGCHNCQFDVHLLNILKGFLEDGFDYFSKRGKIWRNEWVPECWGWKMTRLRDGGSIVTYGATALGHTKEDKSSFTGGINELEVEMFRQYGVEDVVYAGDILKNAVYWYLDTYPVNWDSNDEMTLKDTWVDVQVVESYILFGDPSLKIGGYH